MASLYDNSDLYDLVASRDEAMERFYVEAAAANGRSVLELACGTGRLTIPVAKAGLDVVGIDLSPAMLTRANQAAAEHGVTVETHLSDMRDFDLAGRRFDTVLIAANSIAHLLTAEDFSGFFASVRRHLAPGGQLLFDCFVPSIALLSRPGQRQMMPRVTHPLLGELTIEEVIDFDPLTQISDTTWYWSSQTERDFHVTDLLLRAIFPQELPLLVQAGGFRLR